MVAEEMLAEHRQHMERSLDVLRRDLSTVRTGRANPALIENVAVDYYGAPTPLLQLASISSPDARQLLVQPYDRTAMGSIEKAIRSSDLGLNPTNDGQLIRIAIPQLTEERRRDLVRVVHKRVEEAKVAIRNVRREFNDRLKKMRKDKELTEDEQSVAEEDLDKMTQDLIREADSIGRAKEAELLEV